MADTALDQRMTVEEFHEWHERQEWKYELVDGVPVLKRGMGPTGMVGGTLRHAKVAAKILRMLGSRLDGTPCEPFGSDIAVRTGPDQLRYPDVVVDCGTEDQTRRDLDDPRVVIEVLSPSTSFLDQTKKLEEYKGVGTVQHVLIVDPRRGWAQLFSRQTGTWRFEEFNGLDRTVPLPAIGVELPMAEVFENVTLDEA